MLSAGDDIDVIQATLLRTLASAHRLRIVHLLGTRSCEVNELATALGLSPAAASQNLAALRAVGIVEAIRDGRAARYRLTDPEIRSACELMRGALVRRLTRLGDLAAAASEPADSVLPPVTVR
jgi:DNA-binding transcriptional ArsR family regulator